MYRRQRSRNGGHFAPNRLVYVDDRPHSHYYDYPEYQVVENNSYCNCEDCTGAVNYCQLFCSCCEPYAYASNMSNGPLETESKTTRVIDTADVIDLTLSDSDNDEPDKVNQIDADVQPEDFAAARCTETSTSVTSRSVGLQRAISLESQNNQELGCTRLTYTKDERTNCAVGKDNDKDDWSSDGSGEFDLNLEFEKIKQSKKRRKLKNQQNSAALTKRRKVQGKYICEKASKCYEDDKMGQKSLLDDTFLPRKGRKKALTHSDASISSNNTGTVAPPSDRLGLDNGPIPSPACLDGLSELEKLATFTVSELYPQSLGDLSKECFQTVRPSGSKHQHTGGVLNDILNKVHLRSKVKL